MDDERSKRLIEKGKEIEDLALKVMDFIAPYGDRDPYLVVTAMVLAFDMACKVVDQDPFRVLTDYDRTFNKDPADKAN